MHKETILAHIQAHLETMLHLANNIKSDDVIDDVTCDNMLSTTYGMAKHVNDLAQVIGCEPMRTVGGEDFVSYASHWLKSDPATNMDLG